MVRQERKGDVAGRRRESIAESGTIHEERQVVFMAHGLDVEEFGGRVESAIFRREGDIDHAWEYDVLVCIVGIEAHEQVAEVGSRDFAFVLRQRDDLVPAKFDGSTLVRGDMCCFGSHHTLIRLKDGVDDSGVGLSAST